MSQLMRPILGDLLFNGIIVFGWLFVFLLIADAWWRKRQARLLREQWKGAQTKQTNRRARIFSKRLRWELATLVAVFIVKLILVHSKGNESSGSGDLSSYATNFQGNATHLVPVAKTISLSFDTPSPAGVQTSAQTNIDTLMFDLPPYSQSPELSLSTRMSSASIPSSSHH